MRFFAFQQDARGQTRRLLFWFVVMVLLLMAAINVVMALAWTLMVGAMWTYPPYFFVVNSGVTLLFVLGGWWIETSSLAGGGETLARRLGAREARPSSDADEQRFVNIVNELSIASGMRAPLPMVLAQQTSINALAAGWTEQDAVVAVTQGAIEALTREEMQGLVAHELSHIREGDTRLNMRLAGMVFGLEMIFRLGQSLMASDDRGRRHVGWLMGLAIMAVGWLGWMAGHALQAAVSRQREYLADARAVQWTRSRDGLGRVLRKVLGEAQDRLQTGMTALPQVQHMWLVSSHVSGWVDRWFDAHPPLTDRIARIYGGRMPPLPRQEGRSPEPASLAFVDTLPLTFP